MDRDGKEEKKRRIEKTKRRRKEGDMKKILLGLVIVFIMAVPALAAQRITLGEACGEGYVCQSVGGQLKFPENGFCENCTHYLFMSQNRG